MLSLYTSIGDTYWILGRIGIRRYRQYVSGVSTARLGLEVLKMFRFTLIQPVANLSLTSNTKTSSSYDRIIRRVEPDLPEEPNLIVSHRPGSQAGHLFRQIFSLLGFKSLSVFQLFISFLVKYPLRLHRDFQQLYRGILLCDCLLFRTWIIPP